MLARDNNGNLIQAAQWGASQVVAIGATSTASTAVASTELYVSRAVRIVATIDCWVAVGTAPTATASSIFLPASSVEYISVAGSTQIACIAATGGQTGSLSIVEIV